MSKKLFIIKSIELVNNVFLEVLFDKEMIPEELIECQFRIRVLLAGQREYKETTKFRYVYQDNMVSIDSIIQTVLDLLKKVLKTIEAVDTGVNILKDFNLDNTSLNDTEDIEIRKEMKKALQNITEYKLQPYIIDLYNSILVKYKGSDTLQKRKYEQMIKAQEDALQYEQNRRIF